MQCDCEKVSNLLKTARGQIDGILNMIENDRYCIDVMTQVMATTAILKKVNSIILKGHMQNCVNDAFTSGDEQEKSEKIDEIIKLLDKMNK
ncbi:MAG: metal-sensing transcriptional repressor [Acutalibacteraceae bacterium]|nr:metal-sensing transcriptional repressor [Acutalibacteraceae bacterium]